MAKLIDLTGQRFGMLTVIRYSSFDKAWVCQCDCGNVVLKKGYYLTHKQATTCGKHSNVLKIQNKNFIDLTNQKFGHLTVIKYDKEAQKWMCRCDCGNDVLVKSQNLRMGKTTKCQNCSGSSIIDIKDKQFGEWTVLEYVGNGFWKCRCSCGVERNVDGMRLRNGSSTNCGHIRDNNNLIDLSNKQFGEWKVIRHIKNDLWQCECSCGEIRNVRSTYLRNGKSTSCGHTNTKLIDISNKRFGKLTTIRYVREHNKWECKCDCGNITEVYSTNLRSGDTTSCGCEADKPKIDANKLKNFLNDKESIFLDDIASAFSVSVQTARNEIRAANMEHKLNKKFGSRYEKEVYTYLTDNGIECTLHNRTILAGLEIDIYIPDKKIGIEINGDYWHSSEFKDTEYHQNKTIACAKQGIRLIHIFEYEFINNREIVYNLLDNIVKPGYKIYANKVNIKAIDNDIYKNFLSKYHFGQYASASIKYGAYYNDELVGIASFDKPRFNVDYDYEMIRLVYKDGIHIVGGTEKFIHRFIKEIKPKNIYSYCDMSKFTGNSYTRCGFKCIGISKPGYVWVDIFNGHSVLSRYQVQYLVKHSELTEDELMTSNGYFKIFNCGNLKFLLEMEEK